MFPGIESLHRRIITNSGPRHRLPGQPSLGHKRGMHCCLGHLQRECSCLLLSTHTHNMANQANHSTLSTFTASHVGSRLAKCVPSTTGIGSSRNTAGRCWNSLRIRHTQIPPTIAARHHHQTEKKRKEISVYLQAYMAFTAGRDGYNPHKGSCLFSMHELKQE